MVQDTKKVLVTGASRGVGRATAAALGGHLPVVSDDGGTPFAVVVIPVDDNLAIKAQP